MGDDVEDRHHVGVREPRDSPRLQRQQRGGGGLEGLGAEAAHHLQRDLAPQLRIPGPIDLTHGADAEDAAELAAVGLHTPLTNTRLTTPGGRALQTQRARSVTLADPANVLSVARRRTP